MALDVDSLMDLLIGLLHHDSGSQLREGMDASMMQALIWTILQGSSTSQQSDALLAILRGLDPLVLDELLRALTGSMPPDRVAGLISHNLALDEQRLAKDQSVQPKCRIHSHLHGSQPRWKGHAT